MIIKYLNLHVEQIVMKNLEPSSMIEISVDVVTDREKYNARQFYRPDDFLSNLDRFFMVTKLNILKRVEELRQDEKNAGKKAIDPKYERELP